VSEKRGLTNAGAGREGGGTTRGGTKREKVRHRRGMACRGEARRGVITSTMPGKLTDLSEGTREAARGRGLNKRLNIPSINFKRCKISANSMVGAIPVCLALPSCPPALRLPLNLPLNFAE